jgi:hypothetical protein
MSYTRIVPIPHSGRNSNNNAVASQARIFNKYKPLKHNLLKCNVSIILLLLLLLLTAIELSLGGSSPYTSTDKTNKNKYT